VSDVRAIPSSLRLLNQRRLLNELLILGAASRAELATRTGMSAPTSGKISRRVARCGRTGGAAISRATHGVGWAGRGALVSLETGHRGDLDQLGVTKTHLAAVPWAPAARQLVPSFATTRSERAFLRKLQELVRMCQRQRPGFRSVRARRLRRAPGAFAFGAEPSWIERAARKGYRGCVGIPGCGVQEIRALALGHKALQRSAKTSCAWMLVKVPEQRL
jgi:hypothetical protein